MKKFNIFERAIINVGDCVGSLMFTDFETIASREKDIHETKLSIAATKIRLAYIDGEIEKIDKAFKDLVNEQAQELIAEKLAQ